LAIASDRPADVSPAGSMRRASPSTDLRPSRDWQGIFALCRIPSYLVSVPDRAWAGPFGNRALA